jgi:hypothetical protein
MLIDEVATLGVWGLPALLRVGLKTGEVLPKAEVAKDEKSRLRKEDVADTVLDGDGGRVARGVAALLAVVRAVEVLAASGDVVFAEHAGTSVVGRVGR